MPRPTFFLLTVNCYEIIDSPTTGKICLKLALPPQGALLVLCGLYLVDRNYMLLHFSDVTSAAAAF
jgi:hypothetical protein